MSACAKCKKPLMKSELKKRVEGRRQPDGRVFYFGVGTGPGLKPLDQAAGVFVAMYHYKCYFVMKKHDRMGPNGRYFEESPTAYEASLKYENRDDLSAEAKTRREKAEAEYAELQLKLKLVRESVASETTETTVDAQELLDLEKELADAEAAVALAKRQEEVAAERDKEATPNAWNDWRDPVTAEVEEL